MKKIFSYSFTIIFLLSAVQLFAQDEKRKRYEHFQERTISKTYPASGNTLNIEAMYGSVKIITWDKNEIKVDVHIEASSTNKEWADKTFEALDVKENHSGKNIIFKTTVASIKMNCNNCSNTMNIDYEVHMPSANALNIENRFGSTEIPDFNGPVSLNVQYGSIKTGKMPQLKQLNVEFGSAKITSLSNSNVNFKYSSINIDHLSGTNTINMEFCGYSRINMGSDLTALTVNDSYSVVHLDPAPGFSATYDVSTSYGSFFDKSNANIKRTDTPDKYGPDLDKHYGGKSGSGASKVTVKSSFGSIMIGEGGEKDMKDKKKADL